jgi:hydroxypyruvate isomerase
MNLRFSANLGFLWRDLPVGERIARAAGAGFDAVEFLDEPVTGRTGEVAESLAAARIGAVALNSFMGATKGIAALPQCEEQARAAVERAVEAASVIGADLVHMTAGIGPAVPQARACYLRNLTLCCDLAQAEGKGVVIEPISQRAMPGYFLSSPQMAIEMLEQAARPNLGLLLDAYHLAAMGHDPAGAVREYGMFARHVQIASLPGRNEPRPDEIAPMLEALADTGYAGAIGCEYLPEGESVEAGLGFIAALRARFG